MDVLDRRVVCLTDCTTLINGMLPSHLWSPLAPSWWLSGEKEPGMLHDSSESSMEDLSEASYSLL
ncbi:hypothetical protein EYF80_044116 [Liparis tanakae]|uniref:Uncharacterized protein n=1 Tax=Liparis tanakae TaxID=230148 RepID=A0A4Z2FWS4_9TELE|nr:hypothetical protein EYF80_044116 [Liparis tanakae]